LKIFGFHGNVPELNLQDELLLTVLWRERWTAAGWEPIILNEWHAQQHPLFANLYAATSKLPTSNPKAYELFCFLRWAALAQVGGGFMSDFDLLPRPSFSIGCLDLDGAGRLSKLHIFQTPCCPAFAYCPADKAEKFCQAMIEADGNLGNAGFNSLRGPAGFYSDLSVTKDIPITERIKGQFRMDAFNVFNHPVYAFSGNNGANNCVDCQNSAVTSNNGRITDIEGGTSMRALQFALRFNF